MSMLRVLLVSLIVLACSVPSTWRTPPLAVATQQDPGVPDLPADGDGADDPGERATPEPGSVRAPGTDTTGSTRQSSTAGWSVALKASRTTPAVGAAVTLTARANQPVGATPYSIYILLDGRVICVKGFGTECTTSVSSNEARSRSYVAVIGRSNATQVVARSARLPVTWANRDRGSNLSASSLSASNLSVTLQASQTAVPTGGSVKLTARANRDVGPTPHSIYILLDGRVVCVNSYGTQCTTSVSSAQPLSRSYVAVLGRSNATQVVARSSPVAVTWRASREDGVRNLSTYVARVAQGTEASCRVLTCRQAVTRPGDLAGRGLTIGNIETAAPQAAQVRKDLASLDQVLTQYGRGSSQARAAAEKLHASSLRLHRTLIGLVPGLASIFPAPPR